MPTDYDAAMAGMSTKNYIDYFFTACLQNYDEMERNQRPLQMLMQQTDRVHITGPGTDLAFSIKNIPVRSCHGECNIPDGEVFTAPIRDSVEGEIAYNAPTAYNGREWSNVRLKFSKGKIVEADCDQGAAALNEIFDTDEGARYVGEFAIGTNWGIRQPAKNILFDEKIYGSFHFTPGCAYDNADNGNRSAVHWDLVKILAQGGGRIEFDEKPVMEDGVFVHSELLSLNPPE